ncbi:MULTISPECIES: hypothetical protein [Variovorax]|uniref:hypothetical protein n=1 Tax=Variovorax TaxID=34072 RepID=UPI002857E959|nr:hypothetical protein [Variovorax sp. 3319]MDR6890909.1 hypothetical protein [Variovorax sp. 3319]
MPYLFLMRLMHLQLPARITDPEDLQAVSVLLATGLIEAEIQTSRPTGRYAASRAATVFRITEAGYAELRSMRDTRTHDGGTG